MNLMRFNTFALLILKFLLCFGAAGDALAVDRKPASPRRANIVLIMADDLGYECLGSYGGTSYRTPNLDALAVSGMRFTNCFSTPKCSPSRVTLMTGRYTLRTTTTWGLLPRNEITFGRVLHEAGYATALAGKWQMILQKTDPGHVRRFGFQESAVWAWHEGPRYYEPMLYHNDTIMQNTKDKYGPDLYCDFLIDFIETNQEQPFLAYYPMALTHWPKKDEPAGPNGKHLNFKGMVEEMDRQVGKLTAVLDRLGLRENTLILFTGDNGTPTNVTSIVNGKKLKGGKGKLTDAGTRVPLLASWPGTIKAGSLNTDLVDFTDFMPTLAELAGTAVPQDRVIDGQSFVAALKGKNLTPRQWVYTWWSGKEWLRDNDWKLYADGRLFHMKEDSDEAGPINVNGDDVAANAAREKLARLMADLKKSAVDERQ
ncbi:MAG: sulfatase-like hydrolase/transferase [Pirellulaceae bacterium]|nr:sulfatase-like hydrolase/transferase [Pirellulaceae bacterium]